MTVTVTAKVGEKTLFLAEAAQAGIFSLRNIPEAEMDPLLGIACPTILYPYVREVISDLVTRGGFPPVLLAPVSFEALYAQRNQGQAGRAAARRRASDAGARGPRRLSRWPCPAARPPIFATVRGKRRRAVRRAFARVDAAVRRLAPLSARSDRQPRSLGEGARSHRRAGLGRGARRSAKSAWCWSPATRPRRGCAPRRRAARLRRRANVALELVEIAPAGWLRVRHCGRRRRLRARRAGLG